MGHYAPRGAGQSPVARIYSHFRTYRFHPEYKRESHDPQPNPQPDPEPSNNTLGPIFDGSFGIDTEDLINCPGIDFSTLQYYPDQTPFGPDGDINLLDPRNVAQNGVDWVKLHAKTGKS